MKLEQALRRDNGAGLIEYILLLALLLTAGIATYQQFGKLLQESVHTSAATIQSAGTGIHIDDNPCEPYPQCAILNGG